MRKDLLLSSLFVAFFALCGLLAGCARVPEKSPDNANIQELKDLRSEIGELKAEIIITRSEVAKLRQEVGGGEPSTNKQPILGSGAALQQLLELRKDIKELKAEIVITRSEVAKLGRGGGQRVAALSKVSIDDDPALGSRTAKIGLIEFSDYQCPFCRRFHTQTFDQLKRKYIDTGKVLYVLRDFPLDFHRQAKSAAIAANCAGEQGAYWAMKRQLFANSNRFGPAFYQEAARSLKLNIGTFQQCLNDPRQAKEIESDMAYGDSIGVRGTPAFFVGRLQGKELVDAKLISGARSLGYFSRVIDNLLEPGS